MQPSLASSRLSGSGLQKCDRGFPQGIPGPVTNSDLNFLGTVEAGDANDTCGVYLIALSKRLISTCTVPDHINTGQIIGYIHLHILRFYSRANI